MAKEINEKINKDAAKAEQLADGINEKVEAITETEMPNTTDVVAPPSDVVAPEATETTEVKVTTTPSKRDAFRKRYAEKYPDINMDDEDAYYESAGKSLDELEDYETKIKNLGEHVRNTPKFAEMMAEARDNKDFDPVVWLVQRGELDIDALKNDPDYAAKLAEAQKVAQKAKAESDDIEKQRKDNLQPSMDAISKLKEDKGYSDEQVESALADMYKVMDELIVNKVDPSILEKFIKGSTADEDIENARAEGKAQGLNTKVNEKLRSMPTTNERTGGTQKSMPEKSAPSVGSNMFGI